MSDENKTEIAPGVFMITLPRREVEADPEMKSGSGEIKENLVSDFPGTKEKDWKRVWKRKLGEIPARLFNNEKIGIQVLALQFSDEEGEESGLHEVGNLLFYAAEADGEEYGMEGASGSFVMFAPETFWKRNHYIPDQHFSHVLEHHYNVPVDRLTLEELSENQFLAPGFTVEQITAELTALGLTFEPEMARAGQWED